MEKLKRKFGEHPLSLAAAVVALMLVVVGVALLTPSLLYAGYICAIGAAMLGMFFDV